MSSVQACSGRAPVLLHPVRLGSKHATVYAGHSVGGMQRAAPRTSRKQLQVQNFKFLKQLGLKKPGFLPDFGKVRMI